MAPGIVTKRVEVLEESGFVTLQASDVEAGLKVLESWQQVREIIEGLWQVLLFFDQQVRMDGWLILDPRPNPGSEHGRRQVSDRQ